MEKKCRPFERLKGVLLTFNCEALKEMPTSVDLPACTFSTILFVIFLLSSVNSILYFAFNQIVNKKLRKKQSKSSPWQCLELQLLWPYRQVMYFRELLATLLRYCTKKKLLTANDTLPF